MFEVDVIVTNTKTPTNAHSAEKLLAGYANKFNDKLDVKIKYYCTQHINVERSQVSEHDWLLFNAASRHYVAEIDYSSLSNVRSSTFAGIVEVLTTLPPIGEVAVSRDGIAQLTLPNDGGIRGVVALYYKAHNRCRKIRYMDSVFAEFPRVALLVPMSLRGLPAGELPILQELAPGLQATFSHCHMNRALYLGVDDDEPLSPSTLENITIRFTRRLGMAFEGVTTFPSHWRQDSSGMAKMYNALFERAMMDGYDFAIQLQDDTRMETPMWDRLLGSNLCLSYCAVGAFSPQDRFEPNRMRNVMVARTHYDIFGFFCNELAEDTSEWFRQVLAHCSGVKRRTVSTNTVRQRRRNRNGTNCVYGSVGKCDPQIVEQDRAHFQAAYWDTVNRP